MKKLSRSSVFLWVWLSLTSINVILTPAAYAGAWLQESGATYFKASTYVLAGKNVALTDGTHSAFNDLFIDASLNTYLEYGLSPKLTFIYSGRPIGYAKITDSVVYVGQQLIGLRTGDSYGHNGTHKIAFEMHLGVAPGIGNQSVGSGVSDEGTAFFYRPTVSSTLIDGELQWGRSFWKDWWTSIAAGTRVYSHPDFEPAIYGNAALGSMWGKNLSWNAHAQAHIPTGKIDVENTAGVGETQYIGIGATFGYSLFRHLAVTATIDGAIPGYRAQPSTPSLQLGIEWKS